MNFPSSSLTIAAARSKQSPRSLEITEEPLRPRSHRKRPYGDPNDGYPLCIRVPCHLLSARMMCMKGGRAAKCPGSTFLRKPRWMVDMHPHPPLSERSLGISKTYRRATPLCTFVAYPYAQGDRKEDETPKPPENRQDPGNNTFKDSNFPRQRSKRGHHLLLRRPWGDVSAMVLEFEQVTAPPPTHLQCHFPSLLSLGDRRVSKQFWLSGTLVLRRLCHARSVSHGLAQACR